jgi:hypothetical protein
MIINTNKKSARKNKKKLKNFGQYEQPLYQWVVEERKVKHEKVSNKDILNKLQSLVNGDPNFNLANFNKVAIQSFKKRNNIVLRSITHTAQGSTLDPDDQWLELVQWLINYNTTANRFPKSRLYNADECPYWIDAPHKKTLDIRGSKTIDLVTTGNEKARFTVVKTIRADGKMLPPFIIFKGKYNKINYIYILK